MTRLFLAAGVAALAIATPAAAKPGGGHGGGGQGGQAAQERGAGGGGQRAQAFQRGGGGGGDRAAMRAERQQQRFAMPRQERQQFRAARMEQPRNIERQQVRAQQEQARNRGFERQQLRAQQMEARNRGLERQQLRAQQMEARNRGIERQQLRAQQMEARNRGIERQQLRAHQMEARNRGFGRQQLRAQQMEANRGFDRQQLRAQRMEEAQNRASIRQQLRGDTIRQVQQQALIGSRLANERFAARREALRSWNFDRNQQLAFERNWDASRFAALDFGNRVQIAPLTQAVRYVGVPVASYAGLAALPGSVSYLYPDTPDYYYRYGNGYLYEVDRSSNIIAALLPLLAGGYMPGQYLPQTYMASYVPNYYGFNSFYPDYGGTCNRYANGVVYEVDCNTGLVEDVIPLYASGYGVGQILPSSYAYYNVPYQYRTMYYDTADYGYWYAPGAIYQYDQGSSMITSVAALLSPGFTVGQPLPAGYDVYNVPYSYRATYYDTPNAWYRYNNGYIYQVDPTTQLVTAIVASLLT